MGRAYREASETERKCASQGFVGERKHVQDREGRKVQRQRKQEIDEKNSDVRRDKGREGVGRVEIDGAEANRWKRGRETKSLIPRAKQKGKSAKKQRLSNALLGYEYR
eukprot:6198282-Pleurochrysis_carterae.AAC.2